MPRHDTNITTSYEQGRNWYIAGKATPDGFVPYSIKDDNLAFWDGYYDEQRELYDVKYGIATL